MVVPSPDRRREDDVGLCGRCEHSRVIENARGSRFYLCRLSETDPKFRRYPRLPVVACEGYREVRDEALGPDQSSDS